MTEGTTLSDIACSPQAHSSRNCCVGHRIVVPAITGALWSRKSFGWASERSRSMVTCLPRQPVTRNLSDIASSTALTISTKHSSDIGPRYQPCPSSCTGWPSFGRTSTTSLAATMSEDDRTSDLQQLVVSLVGSSSVRTLSNIAWRLGAHPVPLIPICPSSLGICLHIPQHACTHPRCSDEHRVVMANSLSPSLSVPQLPWWFGFIEHRGVVNLSRQRRLPFRASFPWNIDGWLDGHVEPGPGPSFIGHRRLTTHPSPKPEDTRRTCVHLARMLTNTLTPTRDTLA